MAKYLELYEKYKSLITSGMMAAGTKLPSVRRASAELSLSRTTVENAYATLAAEGYVSAKPQSGYFVNDLLLEKGEKSLVEPQNGKEEKNEILYDLVSIKADKESFDFALWRRYIKSALRQDTRLLSYGDSRGESDLRAAAAKFVREQRGVVGSAENVVVSAGTQSLLSFLCVLFKKEETVVFLGAEFPKGKTVFEDYGKRVINLAEFDEKKLSEIGSSLIYVSPSHFDSEGGVLSVGERRKIVEYARRNSCFVIEDDYDSEFRYTSRPIMSLQGLDGGRNVVYIGSFSRLLLPSIRVSFMVLPQELFKEFEKRALLYNQTASKTEQIALCQYITDGHLLSRIKRQRRSYAQKSEMLCRRGNELLKGFAAFSRCEAAYLIKVKAVKERDSREIAHIAAQNLVKVRPSERESGTVFLSCAGFDAEKTDDMLKRLKAAFV